jgi:hypothetical protein
VCGVAGLLAAALAAVSVAWGREVADVIRRGRASGRTAKPGKAG